MERAWDIVRQSSAMPIKSSHKMKKVDGATREIGMQGRSGICCAQEHSGLSGVYLGSDVSGACVLHPIVCIVVEIAICIVHISQLRCLDSLSLIQVWFRCYLMIIVVCSIVVFLATNANKDRIQDIDFTWKTVLE
jgi:hypothetical protein